MIPVAEKLLFIEKPGIDPLLAANITPESKKQVVTIDEMVAQLETKSKLDGENDFGLITHSFGNYLALKLLEKGHNHLKAIIMLNPVPFTFNGWKEALNNIIKKVPLDILSKIEELSEPSNLGTELFRLIYPYYIGNKSAILPIPFNRIVCNSITAQVKKFNDLKLIENTNIPMVRIVGSIDPFYTDPDAMKEKTLVLEDMGHYPFFEDPSQFSTAVLELKEILCQTTM